MGFRYRKTVTLLPGVRMSITPKGIGYSAGVRGARMSRSATGRVTRTMSIPGTGLSHVQTLSSGSRSHAPTGSRSAGAAPYTAAGSAPAAPKPGMFAPPAEKELYRAVVAGPPRADELPKIGREHPDVRVLAAALEGFFQFQLGNHMRARKCLAWAFVQPDPFVLPFARKYLAGATVTVEISDGVTVALPMDRTAVALAVAELHQEAGDLDAAIATVERVDPPTVFAALSLAELYVEAGRFRDAVEITDGIGNADDASALLCVFRGIALREQGFHDAAREAFKEALRFRSRSAEVRHRALIERASSYLAQGRNAMARKDLEKVLAEDSDAPGLAQALAQLPI